MLKWPVFALGIASFFALTLALSVTTMGKELLSVEEAQHHLFPMNPTFEKQKIILTKKEEKSIKKYSGSKVSKDLEIWKATSGSKLEGWFFIDKTIGKHEYITYALGIDSDGQVTGLEVLDYRETYGGEVSEFSWRKQFLGKKNGDNFKLDDDIDGISGATLSSRNLTAGVKKLCYLHKIKLSEK